MELIFVRHGTTQGNLERRFIGVLDIPLAPEGEELARKVAPTLPAVEHVYRSPMLRCRQTADLLWPDVEKTVIDELHETDFGPFEGKNHEELKDDPLYQQWISADGDFSALPVGESAEDCARRMVEGFRKLTADAQAHGYQRVGVVSHGGALMNLFSKLGTPQRPYYEWLCTNCGGFRMEWQPEDNTLRVVERVGGSGE